MFIYKVIVLTALFVFSFAFIIFPIWEETNYLNSDHKYAAFFKKHWKWAIPLFCILLAIFLPLCSEPCLC